jgi:tryptophan 2,3-dioxygenase
MDTQQFLKFRMSLLPASGFQSGQFRIIEIISTDLILLTGLGSPVNEQSGIEEQLQHLYWRSGATELATGQKTLTLVQFEEKYQKAFFETAQKHQNTNLRKIAQYLSDTNQLTETVIATLKEYDQLVNVQWKLMHYKSAVRYLDRSPESIAATGGTNWQKYLPPRFQKRVFFPELWSTEELENWGKSWVMDRLSENG